MNTAALYTNILGYSDAAQLQRRNSYAVTELVLRWSVYWPNRLGWRQKVLQPSNTFMLLSWWCPLGHGKWHLPAIQFILTVRLIPILTHLSSRWTVPLRGLGTETLTFLRADSLFWGGVGWGGGVLSASSKDKLRFSVFSFSLYCRQGCSLKHNHVKNENGWRKIFYSILFYFEPVFKTKKWGKDSTQWVDSF